MVSFKACSTKTHNLHARCFMQVNSLSVARSRTVLLALPHELIYKITDHLVTVQGLVPGSAFISAKPCWSTVAGFANASRDTREITLRAWFRVLIVREEEDWNVAAAFSAARLSVREIFVNSRALSPTTSSDALLGFPALRAAHINAHNDVSFDPRAGYTYYTLLPNVPKGLKRLAITHAHAPDAERLDALVNASKGRHGLQLEEIRLGRCTLFDCAIEGCSYWPAFPHDHDAYFSDDGAVEYAASIAHDLTPLRALRKLHLGVYLTPHIALSTHQHHHASFAPAPLPPLPTILPPPPTTVPVNHQPFGVVPPAPVDHLHPPPPHHMHLLQHPYHRAPLHSPSLWASPCTACLEQFGPATEVAEHAACTALGGRLPWLEEISWAGYFERYGRGVSTWEKERGDWVRG